MPKPAKFSATSEWSTLLKQGEGALKESSGEVYRVQPVDLETFVTGRDYLKQDTWGMSEAQREFLATASDLENSVNFFVLFVGKGGGKNWASGILFLYVVYKLLCMYDPHKYLGKGNSDKSITLINVAINAQQATKNFFNPMASILRHAGPKAFRDFGFDPDDGIQANQIRFPKNIEILSANSKAGGIEGYDILLALADEVDDVEFHSVEKILNTLRTSSQSRFRGKEKVVVISYRRYVGSSGKILDYYNSAVGHDHIYARKYASWEFHPILREEDFKTYYEENPEKAACMYGSQDTGSFVDSWIKDSKRIKLAMNLNRKWILDWPLPYQVTEPGTEEWLARENHAEWKQSPISEHTYKDDNGVLQVLDPYNLPVNLYGDSKFKYVFVGDPALGSEANGGDGYGVVLAHRELLKDDEGRKFVRPVIDMAFRFTGRMFEEGQVQMSALENLISKLRDRMGYNIKVFSFDGWNSASLSQWIAKTYRDVIVYDRNLVEFKDYTVLRDAIFGEAPPSNGKGEKESNGGIDIPWHPIVFEELRSLREDRTKNPPKVDHPDNGSKDIADTVAKACRILIYEWPYREIHSAGTTYQADSVESKIRGQVATPDDFKKYQEDLNSSNVGLGSWRNLTSEKMINLSNLIPQLDL